MASLPWLAKLVVHMLVQPGVVPSLLEARGAAMLYEHLADAERKLEPAPAADTG